MLFFWIFSECLTLAISNGMISSDHDKPCIFPWKHSDTGGTWYTGCANPDDDSGGNWCPTKLGANRVYQSGSGEWGYCNKNSLACNVQGEFIGCYMRCKAEDIIVHMPLSSVCRRVWN